MVDRIGGDKFLLDNVFDHIDQDFFHILDNLDYFCHILDNLDSDDTVGKSKNDLTVVVDF